MPEQQLKLVNMIAITVFGVVLVDFFILHGVFKHIMPKTFNEIAWYYILAGLPHIVASYVAYCNKEYITYYAKEIKKSLLFTSGIFLLFILFLPSLLIYFFVVYTMYHVASQQLGICKKYTKHTRMYLLWSVVGTLAVVSVALSVGGESGVFIYPSIAYILKSIGILFLTVFTVSSLYLFRDKSYPRSTSIAIIFASIAVYMGYPLIGIIMIRFIHDVSAFCIYCTHDMLYQKKYGDNVLYSFFRIPTNYIYIFLPVFAITVSFLLQLSHSFFFVVIGIMLAFNHYHLEGVVWKRGSLHRRTIG
ncbi:MAG: hypothetical protein KBC41_01185 [Candidatus Pacebacteria bacterium]|nr:hypothetical protein [Candidatus Paceibacterota bacterium]MBP9866676.1 hypothetical protein [Candidatus Paceibacterota bacterium]